jgi:Do/DeqQ family serine protease
MRNIAKIILVSALGGALTLGAYKVFFEQPKVEQIVQTAPTSFMRAGFSPADDESFTYAAEKTVNSVVHVTTAVESNGYAAQSPLDFFFGNPRSYSPRVQMGTGSGVIISKDGYIVTNNHVIDNARTIKVRLNDQTEYEAEVVGADPTTDIALIKIKTDVELPFLVFSNSDEARLGEWVLAVGNPFNLTSTVTAGIVSAKGRNIGIINERAAIESFIQTDAVVNPGNSGGALVNMRGELIGINSAISTHTGSFEGYSFAVPSNIVQKVVRDLLEFGTIQRAFIGVNISDVTPQLASKLDIKVTNGVYVGGVTENGAAEDAGIKTGDVIISVDDRKVTKSSELQELIGRKRPGDKVQVLVNREGKEKKFNVELRNMQGTTSVVKANEAPTFITMLGADLKPADSKSKSRLGIAYGLEVKNLRKGVLSDLGIPEGFIITRINRKEVHNENDVTSAVKGLVKNDPVVIEGYTPEGRSKYFAFGY